MKNFKTIKKEVSCMSEKQFEADCDEIAEAFSKSPIGRLLSSKPIEKRSSPKGVKFVYLMKNHRNGLFKIGISKDPNVRERTLQSEEPSLEIVLFGGGGAALEKKLHKNFESVRVRGEWFRLSRAQVEDVREALK